MCSTRRPAPTAGWRSSDWRNSFASEMFGIARGFPSIASNLSNLTSPSGELRMRSATPGRTPGTTPATAPAGTAHTRRTQEARVRQQAGPRSVDIRPVRRCLHERTDARPTSRRSATRPISHTRTAAGPLNGDAACQQAARRQHPLRTTTATVTRRHSAACTPEFSDNARSVGSSGSVRFFV